MAQPLVERREKTRPSDAANPPGAAGIISEVVNIMRARSCEDTRDIFAAKYPASQIASGSEKYWYDVRAVLSASPAATSDRSSQRLSLLLTRGDGVIHYHNCPSSPQSSLAIRVSGAKIEIVSVKKEDAGVKIDQAAVLADLRSFLALPGLSFFHEARYAVKRDDSFGDADSSKPDASSWESVGDLIKIKSMLSEAVERLSKRKTEGIKGAIPLTPSGLAEALGRPMGETINVNVAGWGEHFVLDSDLIHGLIAYPASLDRQNPAKSRVRLSNGWVMTVDNSDRKRPIITRVEKPSERHADWSTGYQLAPGRIVFTVIREGKDILEIGMREDNLEIASPALMFEGEINVSAQTVSYNPGHHQPVFEQPFGEEVRVDMGTLESAPTELTLERAGQNASTVHARFYSLSKVTGTTEGCTIGIRLPMREHPANPAQLIRAVLVGGFPLASVLVY